ncbi:universal stress protein [Natrarchaeobaculum sulfurireducens]|uniref:Universal stress protein n=1 Tax=Natrarchaeobaculum sulfurireducens TaxID=2044521 RepID=A0A346PTG7_9EURY|nr:universal stress protein [Natrarchaeobaculum sulfurireducens]AXR82812.1 Universal stress protein [Natrarchaeobaculum sulfurireducens]
MTDTHTTTFETLLIPTDGSEPAEAAARRGFDLATQCDADVHLLSVADSSIATGAGYAGDSPSIRNRLRELSSNRAASLRDSAVEQGIAATAAVREGIPAKEIITYATEQDVDAIVIGTAGRGSVGRAVVGSVADKVVRTAPVPVITVNPKATTPGSVDSVLVPTDGSEIAAAAGRVGFGFAEELAATVHLLSVVEAARPAWLSALTDGEDTSDESLRADSREALDTLAADARERGLDVETTVTEGTPADGITDYVESEGIDLIAMGTTGRGGFERLLLGSVTDEVVRTAPVPVLTSRGDTSDRPEDADRSEDT